MMRYLLVCHGFAGGAAPTVTVIAANERKAVRNARGNADIATDHAFAILARRAKKIHDAGSRDCLTGSHSRGVFQNGKGSAASP